MASLGLNELIISNTDQIATFPILVYRKKQTQVPLRELEDISIYGGARS